MSDRISIKLRVEKMNNFLKKIYGNIPKILSVIILIGVLVVIIELIIVSLWAMVNL